MFFDDLRVTHVKSPVIETNDYYPFGLTFNSYQRENSVRQSYKFQEKEWQDELDLNLYDFEWRQYDPIIARATTPDPHADSYFGLSPYSFFANNPINTLDPNGMDTIPVNQVNPRTINPEEDVILLDEVVVTASSENSDNSDAAVAVPLTLAPEVVGTGVAVSSSPILLTIIFALIPNSAGEGEMEALEKVRSGEIILNEPVVNYIPAPKTLPGYPGAQRVPRKTGRARWRDANGDILEWDSRHGEVEVYDRQGRHKGSSDPNTGKMKPDSKVPGRKTQK